MLQIVLLPSFQSQEKILRAYDIENFSQTIFQFGIATQTAQKNINLENIKPLKIPIAPLEVQRKFVTMMLALKEGCNKITMAGNHHLLNVRSEL